MTPRRRTKADIEATVIRREAKARKALAAIRAKVGELHVTCEFDTEPQAKAAWERIDREGSLVSSWRYCSLDRADWFVTVMGERSGDSAAEFARCEAMLLEAAGASRIDEPPKGMLEGLRERRWRTTLEGAARGPGDRRQRARYGAGARLSRNGTMSPHQRPQG